MKIDKDGRAIYTPEEVTRIYESEKYRNPGNPDEKVAAGIVAAIQEVKSILLRMEMLMIGGKKMTDEEIEKRADAFLNKDVEGLGEYLDTALEGLQLTAKQGETILGLIKAAYIIGAKENVP